MKLVPLSEILGVFFVKFKTKGPVKLVQLSESLGVFLVKFRTKRTKENVFTLRSYFGFQLSEVFLVKISKHIRSEG